ncbi:MAG: hypothetical protein KGJ48_13165 [Nitrospirota bacterium]|nr:hypothetical protein [Nitrospirota bacterium]
MTTSSFEDLVVAVLTSLFGIMAAYGVGLAIALIKGYRDPYYFYAWPASMKRPIGVVAIYFAIRAAWDSLMLCGALGGLVRLCGLLG